MLDMRIVRMPVERLWDPEPNIFEFKDNFPCWETWWACEDAVATPLLEEFWKLCQNSSVVKNYNDLTLNVAKWINTHRVSDKFWRSSCVKMTGVGYKTSSLIARLRRNAPRWGILWPTRNTKQMGGVLKVVKDTMEKSARNIAQLI